MSCSGRGAPGPELVSFRSRLLQGLGIWSQTIAPHRRCIGGEARCVDRHDGHDGNGDPEIRRRE
eukprot:5621096-Pyramimonas_sp.AAC.1